MNRAWKLIRETIKDFRSDKCSNLAASLAYYTLFSLAPLLLIVVAVASLFFGNTEVQQAIHDQALNLFGTEGAEWITTMVQNAYAPKESLQASFIGILVLLVGATSVFTHIQDSLNTIWSVKPKPKRNIVKMLRDRVLSFSMILVVGFLLLVSLLLSTALSALAEYLKNRLPDISVVLMQIFEAGVSFAIIAALFALMFKFLPDAKITWSDVRAGAVVTALLFAVGKNLIGLYLGSSSVASGYGAAGALVVVLVWVYYSSLIFFLGAEFTQVYARNYGARIVPADYAVQIVRTEQEVTDPSTKKIL